MVTYMKKLSKHDLKDFTRITSHITYGFCDSIEDANCDDDVSEKYPLLGYTYFDHGYDVFLLCKWYFNLSWYQNKEILLSYDYLKINAQKNIASIVIVNALIVSDSVEVESLISFEPSKKDPK